MTAWVVAAEVIWRMVPYIRDTARFGQDSYAYWFAGHSGNPYERPPGAADAFLYSPAFEQVTRPLTALPWPVFASVWLAIETAALLWLLRPVQIRWAVPVAIACFPELYVGNIYLLLAVVAVIGLRVPALWAFPVLTKITPGVGLLWFACRGEWRRLGIAVATTAAVVAVSYAADPSAWADWVRFLLNNGDGAPDGTVGLAVRSVAAVALVVYGARRGWSWVVPVAMLVSCPMALYNLPSFTLLLALPRLLAGRTATARETAPESEGRRTGSASRWRP